MGPWAGPARQGPWLGWAGLWGAGDQHPAASLGQGPTALGWAEMGTWAMGGVGGALGWPGLARPTGAPGALTH